MEESPLNLHKQIWVAALPSTPKTTIDEIIDGHRSISTLLLKDVKCIIRGYKQAGVDNLRLERNKSELIADINRVLMNTRNSTYHNVNVPTGSSSTHAAVALAPTPRPAP